MTDRDPALEPFDALIGTWATEATHPLVDAVVPGTITFEWLEGGDFVVQRSHNDHELFPDAIGGGLRIWRDVPGLAQRFSATLVHVTYGRRDCKARANARLRQLAYTAVSGQSGR